MDRSLLTAHHPGTGVDTLRKVTALGGIAIAAVAAMGLAPGPAHGQDAYTYVVRDVEAELAPAGAIDTVPLDVSTDRNPMRVVQGTEFAWVVPAGDSLTRRNAVMILHENVPVRPGPGDAMVRGWRPAEVARYDTFSFALDRGDRDRAVAGRPAQHYTLRALIQRVSAFDGSVQRFRYAADLWVLPDVPHNWATFGFGTQALPMLVPRLRDTLGHQLDRRGLVARAVIRREFTAFRDGQASERVHRTHAFELDSLARTDAPPSPGPVVEQELLAELDNRVMEDPGPLCMAADEGRVPEEIARDVDGDVRFAILSRITAGCASPELYFGLLEGRLASRPDQVCSAVAEAVDTRSLASALLTAEQRDAFMAFVRPADRLRFLDEMKRYCRDPDSRP